MPMDNLLLGFGIGTSIIGLVVLLYLKQINMRMRRYVLRFERIRDKFD